MAPSRAGAGAASPGLLRRRYSAPEAVMRRYMLGLRRSDSETGAYCTEASQGGARSPSPSPAVAARDLMRRDALMRRLWAAGSAVLSSPPLPSCDSACQPDACTGTPDDIRGPFSLQPSPEIHKLDERPYELLEIVVSETVHEGRTLAAPFSGAESHFDLDEYVSGVLTESLRSLSDRLESGTGSTGADGVCLDIVETEIKVRLRNAAVNTVVHLSPTSNHQIIFGNEELGERDNREPEKRTAPQPADEEALRRVRRLFGDARLGDARLGDGGHGVPSRSVSIEVNATSSEPDRGVSPCASLVDSLDDPTSPRIPSEVASVELRLSDGGEAFFVQLSDDVTTNTEIGCVSDHMPEKLKKRLHCRNQIREMRAESARRERRSAQERDIIHNNMFSACTDSFIEITSIPKERTQYVTRSNRIGATPPRRSISKRATPPNRSVRREKDQSGNTSTCRESDRPPRRVYHKSEIHDGRGRVEILEILEFARSSHGSSETDSDDGPVQSRTRRSRIPVPVHETVRRASLPTNTSSDLRPRSGSLRFDRVFDAIPEERSSVGGDSPARRGSVPTLPSVGSDEALRCSRSFDDANAPPLPAAASRNTNTTCMGAVASRERPSPSSSSAASRGAAPLPAALPVEGITLASFVPQAASRRSSATKLRWREAARALSIVEVDRGETTFVR